MKGDLPEFVTGVVTARHADGRAVKMDLGTGEWRPKNLHPNGYQIDHFELGDEAAGKRSIRGRRRPHRAKILTLGE